MNVFVCTLCALNANILVGQILSIQISGSKVFQSMIAKCDALPSHPPGFCNIYSPYEHAPFPSLASMEYSVENDTTLF